MNNETNDIVIYINNDDKTKIITNEDIETPKININDTKDFINIPRVPSIEADLVNISQGSQTSEDKTDLFTNRADQLLDMIRENKKKIIDNLYIISSKYDLIYFRYNKISLLILILSTIITFIEAIRLTIVNYDTQYNESQVRKVISHETISLIINILSLSLSTLLTILSSIVKFKNYKENMDKLKNIHDTLFNYKCLYNKQKELIKFFKMNNTLTDDLYEKLKETVEGYNRDIKEISIFENIRNEDIIKFNNIKVNHDIKLKELASKREIELLKITINSTNKKKNIEDGKNVNCCFN
jgi:hypothetical protein